MGPNGSVGKKYPIKGPLHVSESARAALRQPLDSATMLSYRSRRRRRCRPRRTQAGESGSSEGGGAAFEVELIVVLSAELSAIA